MLIRPDTSAMVTTQAGQIIEAMIKLKQARYRQQVSRKTFLVRWAKLRVALALTEEYRQWRAAVFAKFPNCKCGQASEEPHHKVRVVDAPHMALQVSNGLGICKKCHTQTHTKRSSGGTRARQAPNRTAPSHPSTQARGSR